MLLNTHDTDLLEDYLICYMMFLNRMPLIVSNLENIKQTQLRQFGRFDMSRVLISLFEYVGTFATQVGHNTILNDIDSYK